MKLGSQVTVLTIFRVYFSINIIVVRIINTVIIPANVTKKRCSGAIPIRYAYLAKLQLASSEGPLYAVPDNMTFRPRLTRTFLMAVTVWFASVAPKPESSDEGILETAVWIAKSKGNVIVENWKRLLYCESIDESDMRCGLERRSRQAQQKKPGTYNNQV